MPTMHYFIDPCLTYFTAKNQIEISFPQLILKTKVIKFLKRMFCLGGFCLGGFWQGGFLSRGFLSGDLCPGGFCPRTQRKQLCDSSVNPALPGQSHPKNYNSQMKVRHVGFPVPVSFIVVHK